MSREYTCANCQGIFTEGWSEEEAKAEYAQIFEPLGFQSIAKEDCVVICDTCWQKMKPVGWQA